MPEFKSFPFADSHRIIIPNSESADHLRSINKVSKSEKPNSHRLSHISILNDGCDTSTACQYLFQSIYGYQYQIDPRDLIHDDMSSKLVAGVAVLLLRGSSSIASELIDEFNAYNKEPYVMIEPSMLDILHFADSVTLDFGLDSSVIVNAKALFTTNVCTYVGIEFGSIGD